jgi:predicted RNA binding protein YcfA (HicA-like mRNA interferase family)
MSQEGSLIHLLRNTPVREFIKALEREGFVLKRKTQRRSHIYAHPDGRIVVIHYHRSSDTLPRGTLKSVLKAIGWTKEDLKRLKLIL